MELQHVNVKVMVQNPGEIDLEPLIPVFHRWIQDKVCPELMLDIADYRHVHEGPGMVLIGYEADYSVDNTDGRLGVRYNRKTAVEGSNQERLAQAARAALTACQHLESEPSLGGKLRFSGREIEISINDRLLAPNEPSVREAIDPELRLFLRKLFGGTQLSLTYGQDPRSLLAASVKAAAPSSTADLLANLGS